MTVNYLRPVPLNQWLQVESHETSVDGRRRFRSAEIADQRGNTLARGTGVFITVDPEKVFAKLR
jgi:acyl-CoA thioesterase FadM